MRCSVVFGVTLRLLVVNISSCPLLSTPPLTTSNKCHNLQGRWSGGVVLTTPGQLQRNSTQKPDIGSESRFLPTHLHSTPPLGGFPSEYCHDVWYGKTRMLWLLDDEKISKISLFVFTECTNVTDARTDRQTPHDGTGRACITSRGKN